MRNLITGINGQDGRILSKMLTEKGEEVFGIARDTITMPQRVLFTQRKVDISNRREFNSFLDQVQPSRIFHLAASHTNSVRMTSHGENNRDEMFAIHAEATKHILEWQKRNIKLGCHSVIALSSQIFTPTLPITIIDEREVVKPSTIYGETKRLALQYLQEYRDKYGVATSGAILFNHSSIYSKHGFVLHALARQIANAVERSEPIITLNNFDAVLDISNAHNVCDAINRMSRMEASSDYILSSGVATSLRDLTNSCLTHYGIAGRVILESKSEETSARKVLIGNPRKAIEQLKWEPTTSPLNLMVGLVEHFRSES